MGAAGRGGRGSLLRPGPGGLPAPFLMSAQLLPSRTGALLCSGAGSTAVSQGLVFKSWLCGEPPVVPGGWGSGGTVLGRGGAVGWEHKWGHPH